jgi:hypothetical protein
MTPLRFTWKRWSKRSSTSGARTMPAPAADAEIRGSWLQECFTVLTVGPRFEHMQSSAEDFRADLAAHPRAPRVDARLVEAEARFRFDLKLHRARRSVRRLSALTPCGRRSGGCVRPSGARALAAEVGRVQVRH